MPFASVPVIRHPLFWRRLMLLSVSFLAFLRPAQGKSYEGFNTDVPFKFKIGSRAFKPGHYQLVIVGNGLLLIRDAKLHVVASVVTRTVATPNRSPMSKLVFKLEKNQPRLAEIRMENRSQFLEVLGEELAIRQADPPAPAFLPGMDSLLERPDSRGLRH